MGLNPHKHYANLEVPADLEQWLVSAIVDHNSRIVKKEWKNKKDGRRQDGAPANLKEFKFLVEISSGSENHIEFIKYLVKKKLETLNYLKECFSDMDFGDNLEEGL